MKVVLIYFFIVGIAFAEVSKDEVSMMLDKMVKDHVISAVEAEKSKIKLKGLSLDQWSEMNRVGKSQLQRGPASVGEDQVSQDPKKLDLDSAQFKQIQEDIKKIVPQN